MKYCILVLIFLASPINAKNWTTREMMEALEWDMAAAGSSEDDLKEAFSFFETSGALLGMSVIMDVNCALYRKGKIQNKDFMMSGQPSMDALGQAFVNYSRNNPKLWDESYKYAAVGALRKNWPCRK